MWLGDVWDEHVAGECLGLSRGWGISGANVWLSFPVYDDHQTHNAESFLYEHCMENLELIPHHSKVMSWLQ